VSHQASPTFIQVAYLAAAICFILGLKRLSSPATARSGNQVAAVGMVVAVLATLLLPGIKHQGLIWAALVVGSIVGAIGARRVAITDMPQMVALLNGLGGGAAALVSAAEFLHAASAGDRLRGLPAATTMFGTLIGSVSFSGSLVAFGKLQSLISEKAIASAATKWINIALFVVLVGLSAYLVGGSGGAGVYFLLLAGSLALGVLLVIPIGGADMPVVISLLNSCTGLAAASTGFVLHNNALIISGTLVGASGTLLTLLMCKAMNRSLTNVLFAGVGAGPVASGAGAAAAASGRSVREITTEDAAVLFSNVQSLIIVPGYGMAVAQAQHVLRELADLLAKRGVDVKYAVHPVAGRMPGHMNVLLAEANVPYTQLYDLEQINSEFERADVALVIGANDVVNPAARTDRTSPIYGMPILDVDKAHHIVVIKRSMKPGFAGIDNALYTDPKTFMLFGDAKDALRRLVEALRAGV
jgi:proton-translocating NAD(P)+ transhydrogenase subunit beta